MSEPLHTPEDTRWRVPEHPPWDDAVAGWVIHETPNWYVTVHPMLFNHRICLTHRDAYPDGWTAAWCYPTFLAAMAAALIWDPETEHAPVGYVKVAADARGAATQPD